MADIPTIQHLSVNKIHGVLYSGNGGPTFNSASQRLNYSVSSDDARQKRVFLQTDTSPPTLWISIAVGMGADKWQFWGDASSADVDNALTVAQGALTTAQAADLTAQNAETIAQAVATDLTTHENNILNPHQVTATQIGGNNIYNELNASNKIGINDNQLMPGNALMVKARSTQSIAAYTYSNGLSGRGATITGNSPSTPFPLLDNVTINVGDRFYFAHGVSATHNGVYELTAQNNGVTGFIATRVLGLDIDGYIQGSMFRVKFGTQYKGAEYIYAYNRALIVGGDNIYYIRENIGSASPNECCPMYEDFEGGNPLINAWGKFYVIGQSGTGAGYGTSISNQNNNIIRGVAAFVTGTTAAAFAGLFAGWSLVNTQPDGLGSIFLASNLHLDLESYISCTTLSTSTQEYAVVFGYVKQRLPSSGGVQVKPADGVYFYYDRQTSLNWQCITASGGVFTTTVTTVPVTAATFNRLQLQKDAGFGDVRFYIDGVLVATHSTNVPTTTLIAFQLMAFKSVGILSVEALKIDYIRQDLQFPQGRAA